MILVIENRFYPMRSGSIDLEASYFHYAEIVKMMVSHSMKLGETHKNFPNVKTILVPDRLNNSKWIGLRNISRLQLLNLLSVSTEGFLMKSIWDTFLKDSISKIATQLEQCEQVVEETIVIISPEINLLIPTMEIRDDSIDLLKNEIDEFCKFTHKLIDQYSLKIKIHLLCIEFPTNVTQKSKLPLTLSDHYMAIHAVFAKYPFLSIMKIDNSEFYFEKEFRSLLSDSIPRISSKIMFPELKNQRASIAVELTATTIDTLNHIHDGLNELYMENTLRKDAVNPVLLAGGGFVLRPTVSQSAARSKHNRLIYLGLVSELLERDRMLLVRVNWRLHGTEYWVLIPPEIATVSEEMKVSIDLGSSSSSSSSMKEDISMIMIKLTNRESYLYTSSNMMTMAASPGDIFSTYKATIIKDEEEDKTILENKEFLSTMLNEIVVDYSTFPFNPLAHPSDILKVLHHENRQIEQQQQQQQQQQQEHSQKYKSFQVKSSSLDTRVTTATATTTTPSSSSSTMQESQLQVVQAQQTQASKKFIHSTSHQNQKGKGKKMSSEVYDDYEKMKDGKSRPPSKYYRAIPTAAASTILSKKDHKSVSQSPTVNTIPSVIYDQRRVPQSSLHSTAALTATSFELDDIQDFDL